MDPLRIVTANENNCNLRTGYGKVLASCIGQMNSGNVHIFGIGQTRWNGEGIFRVNAVQGPDGNFGYSYLVIHCGLSDTAHRGVAIVVSPLLQSFVSSCDFVSDRIVSVDLQVSPTEIGTVIQVYAPRLLKHKDQNGDPTHVDAPAMDKFWNQLKHHMEFKWRSGACRWIIVMGDFDRNEAYDPISNMEKILPYFDIIHGCGMDSKAKTCPNYVKKCSMNFAAIFPSQGEEAHGRYENYFSLLEKRSLAFTFNCSLGQSPGRSHLQVANAYILDLPSGVLAYPKYAIDNNQPSAAHMSIFACSSFLPRKGRVRVKKYQPSAEDMNIFTYSLLWNVSVDKYTNSVDIAETLKQVCAKKWIEFQPWDDWETRKQYWQQQQINRVVTLRLDPHQCANIDGIDFTGTDNFVDKLDDITHLISDLVKSKNVDIKRLHNESFPTLLKIIENAMGLKPMGCLLEGTSNPVFVERGGMLIGKLELVGLKLVHCLVTNWPEYRWGIAHICGTHVFLENVVRSDEWESIERVIKHNGFNGVELLSPCKIIQKYAHFMPSILSRQLGYRPYW